MKTKIIIITGVFLIALGSWVVFNHSSIESEQISIALLPKDNSVVSVGKVIYGQNCASCHGPKLGGAKNWKQRNTDGYLPAPPHDRNGHTWHHSENYLYSMTKYGIEKMIGQKYSNNMPAYEGKLSDEDIIAVLSYIKSTWPDDIQRRHDQLNLSAN
jgi:mono/diheme cytochrome c family protein